MEIDTDNLKNAFNINIDENALRKQTEKYMVVWGRHVYTYHYGTLDKYGKKWKKWKL